MHAREAHAHLVLILLGGPALGWCFRSLALLPTRVLITRPKKCSTTLRNSRLTFFFSAGFLGCAGFFFFLAGVPLSESARCERRRTAHACTEAVQSKDMAGRARGTHPSSPAAPPAASAFRFLPFPLASVAVFAMLLPAAPAPPRPDGDAPGFAGEDVRCSTLPVYTGSDVPLTQTRETGQSQHMQSASPSGVARLARTHCCALTLRLPSPPSPLQLAVPVFNSSRTTLSTRSRRGRGGGRAVVRPGRRAAQCRASGNRDVTLAVGPPPPPPRPRPGPG